MKITLDNIGKKYNREWIFRGINLDLNSPSSHVITGANGSGKSTLLKIISGFETPSEGNIVFQNKVVVSVEKVYKEVTYASPYISVFEEYTIKELLSFYSTFKPLRNNLSYSDFIQLIELEKAEEKPIKLFSSGMKQRVKLGLAILADTSILLLDEPTSNLDKNAIQWYQQLIQQNMENRLVFVASNNQQDESFFCEQEIKIEEYKK